MADLGTELIIDPRDDGLRLRGEIDAHTAPSLRTALTERLAAVTGDLRLHLGAVSFMDSSGLRVVVDATGAARAGGRDLVLVGASPTVRRLIEISGLADHLTSTGGP